MPYFASETGGNPGKPSRFEQPSGSTKKRKLVLIVNVLRIYIPWR